MKLRYSVANTLVSRAEEINRHFHKLQERCSESTPNWFLDSLNDENIIVRNNNGYCGCRLKEGRVDDDCRVLFLNLETTIVRCIR